MSYKHRQGKLPEGAGYESHNEAAMCISKVGGTRAGAKDAGKDHTETKKTDNSTKNKKR